MRILCLWTPSGPSFVRTGWKRAFEYCSHQFTFWDQERQAAHDVFAEVEPQLLIHTTYNIDRAVAKCILARPQMKVALFGSAWGGLVNNLDPKEFPIVRVTDDEKRSVELLKAKANKPDLVFVHVSKKYLEGTMGGWQELGVEIAGIPNGADVLVYKQGKYDPALAADCSFVGGKWGYKSRNLDPWILPLCHPSSGLNVKIFGNSQWPVAQYLGPLEQERERDLYASAVVCPNISEPHSTAPKGGWDVVERNMKVPACGGLVVSDWVDEMREFFTPGELMMVKTPEELRERIHHFKKHHDERQSFIEAGQRRIYAQHTYFHRVASILWNIGLEAEAEAMLRKYEEDFIASASEHESSSIARLWLEQYAKGI